MADNYLQLSESIDDLTKTEVKWWSDYADYCEKTEEEFGDEEVENADPPVFNQWSIEKNSDGTSIVWFNVEEYGDPELVALVVQRFLKECRPKDCFTLTWSETCSKPRLSEFGGGACFVTAEEIEWMGTHEWVAQEVEKFENS